MGDGGRTQAGFVGECRASFAPVSSTPNIPPKPAFKVKADAKMSANMWGML